MTEHNHELAGDSRRDFMKKGTLAATALAVGAGAASTTGSVAAQEDEEGVAVVQAHDFYPEAEFHVLAQLETRSRNEFIEQYDPDEEELDDDYEIYSIRIETGGEGGTLAHLMIDNDVDPNSGDTGTMGMTASYLNPDFNLVEIDVTIEAENDVNDNDVNDNDEDDDEVDEDDDEVDDNDEVDEDDEVDDEINDEDDDEVDDDDENDF